MPETAPVRVRLAVLHAAFDPARAATFARLYETLLQECKGLEEQVDLHVYRELDARGSLLPWLGIMRDGCARAFAERWPELGHVLDPGFPAYPETRDECLALGRFAPTHLAFLPDDVTLGKNFVRGLLRVIEAIPEDVFCGLSNHAEAARMRQAGLDFYITRDAWNGFGAMPVQFAAEHLIWRRRELLPESKHPAEGGTPLEGARVVQHDEGVSLHLMALGRGAVKTLPGLVQHDDVGGSLDGTFIGKGAEISRRSVSFEPELDLAAKSWDPKRTVDAGRSYVGTHWSLVFDMKVLTRDRVELAYACERSGGTMPEIARDVLNGKPVVYGENAPAYADERGLPVDKHGVHLRGHVYIAVPEYQPAVPAQRISLAKAKRALERAGVMVTTDVVSGHSLVTRARNLGIVHQFMKSRANVLVQWDGDVECLDEDALLKMLETKYPIVGGAYPFRDGSGTPCANLPRKPGGKETERELDIANDGTCPASELATGFLMVRRSVLVDLMARHPELLHEQDGGVDVGAPGWALFDTQLVDHHRGRRRRYLSEDWEFSRLAREAGYELRLFVPPIFRHWGLQPADGHMMVAWGGQSWEEVYGRPKR